MKILVLGAGRMGHGAVFDLVHNSPDVEVVTVADFHLVPHVIAGLVVPHAVPASGLSRRLCQVLDRE